MQAFTREAFPRYAKIARSLETIPGGVNRSPPQRAPKLVEIVMNVGASLG